MKTVSARHLCSKTMRSRSSVFLIAYESQHFFPETSGTVELRFHVDRPDAFLAAIESARMMLDHIGEEDAAAAVQKAVKNVLAAREIRTKDLGGSNSTPEVGDAIVKEFLTL